MQFVPPRLVIDRTGKITGRATGRHHACQMEGCRGRRIAVVWPDGKRTFPCTKGMAERGGGQWQIM